jgi:hypothetical protein
MKSHESLNGRKAQGVRWSCLVAMFVGGVLVSASAAAQFATDFENQPYIGSGAGTALTGQDGFYLPPVAGSIGFDVHTYTGNTLGLPVNPTGGEQFVGGPPGPGFGQFIRSQRDMNFGSGAWRISHDFAVTFIGALPSTQNIGSFSLQDLETSAGFVGLATWTDPNTAANWNADYRWFDDVGNDIIETLPDSRFQNLLANHWYRWSTVVNFDTNQILEVSITDISGGGGTATYSPVGRYLRGGSAGGLPLPTGFRFFAGGSGSKAGNIAAFDNLSIAQVPSANLRVSLSGPTTPVRSGAAVPVYLRLDNYGPGEAYAPTVEFTSSAPAGSIAVTPPSGWICDGDGAVFVCMADSKMARGTTRFVFHVTPPTNPPGGFVTINASVSSASVDPVPGNNSASFKLYVKPSGGLISPVAPSTR